ncbi:MAG: hypothetical protein K8I30_00700, partial [Anaerolineae bacterium]|nr:hypothetical protein [Anaerolineae bacterium]
LHLLDDRLALLAKVSDQPLMCCAIWSPDGTRIAFTATNGSLVIWDMRDGQTYPFALPEDGGSLSSWSPDGGSILGIGWGDAYDTLVVHHLDPGADSPSRWVFFDDAFLTHMTWSPDGRFILFQANVNYTPQIYRVDADGRHLQQLTQGKGSFAPRLSPDGARIAFIGWPDSGSELFVMNTDGSGQRQLTRDGGSKATPVRSPDGTAILIQTFFSHNLPSLLKIIDVDSGQQERLAEDAAFDVPPAWSSDGARVLFEKQIGDGSALYVIDSDGQHRRLLFQNPAQPTFRAAWQPAP